MSTNNKPLRIVQMDAIHLDNEIYKILLQIAKDCVSHLPPGTVTACEPELHLLVKLLILNYSIIKSGSTFGQKLLLIKYSDMSHVKRVLYTFFVGLDYLKYRFAMISSFRNVFKMISQIHFIIKILCFINLSIFLQYGEKPRFVERLLCLKQAYARENVQRQFNTKYMTRELLWNGFIEILVHTLPLINYHKIRRIAHNLNPWYKKASYGAVDSSRIFTRNSCCAYCGKPPILPHHMDCPHIFCYTCLKGNQMADPKYECPICEHNGEGGCERVIM